MIINNHNNRYNIRNYKQPYNNYSNNFRNKLTANILY